LVPIQGLAAHVISVATAQDHTLVLTSSGEVFSWGLNRFAQLGYVIEGPDSSNAGKSGSGEPIQPTPRKISGVLKKLVVCGVAACKMASACWTEDEVFTWGTNSGQLGMFFAENQHI
jgi:inhibitor of Bruton tyrosine kinase